QLEAVELRDHRGDAVASVQPRAGSRMLPAEEEAHEVGGGDGIDLAPQSANGEVMDARQEPALAPLAAARARRERAAEHDAVALEARERRLDRRGAET